MLVAYKEVGPWQGKAIPKAFFQIHRTADSVHARLTIVTGSVLYCQDETQTLLKAGDIHDIPPAMPHHLAMPPDVRLDDLTIRITFMREEK